MSRRVLALLVTAAFAALACGGGTPTTTVVPTTPAPIASPTEAPVATQTGKPATGTAEVAIVDNAFMEADLAIKVGTTVTWTNAGDRGHTVTSSDGSFGSGGTLASGATYEHTFDTAGTFAYVCALHGSMKGTVSVTP